jgi:hypothetical protein
MLQDTVRVRAWRTALSRLSSAYGRYDGVCDPGINVTVWDEGQYWETRDQSVLLAELDKMNRLVAGVAGRFYDSTLSVEAPIFEHRNFERLEGG